MANDNFRPGAPCDDICQFAGNTAPGDRRLRDRGEALPRHVIDDVERAEPPAIGERVMGEVQAPAGVGPGLDDDRSSSADRPPPTPTLRALALVDACTRECPAIHAD